MKLIKELTEDVNYLVEEKNGRKELFIEGPFLVAETINRVVEDEKDKKTMKRFQNQRMIIEQLGNTNRIPGASMKADMVRKKLRPDRIQLAQYRLVHEKNVRHRW